MDVACPGKPYCPLYTEGKVVRLSKKFRRTAFSIGSDGVYVTPGIFWEQMFTFAEENAYPLRSSRREGH